MLDTGKMKAVREKRGLSMQQAAEAAGLRDKQRWNDIESGRRANITMETLNQIAAGLGADPRDLLKVPGPKKRGAA